MGLKDKASKAPAVAAKPAKPARRKRAPAKKAATTAAVSVVAGLKKKLGKDGEIALLSQSQALSHVTEFISTGFIGLDDILGGGLAVGRCSEIYGPEGAGKTALAQMATKNCQDAGGVVLYIDFENALDETKILQLGINPDLLIYARPKHMEAAWKIVWEYIAQLESQKPAAPSLILWDSLAATQTKAEAEADPDDATVATAARLLSTNCRKMFESIARVRAHMIFINQERSKIGGFSKFGENKSTYGGAAVKYAASQRLRCSRRMTIKAQGNTGPAIGYLIQTKTDKNRCAPPHQAAAWVLDFRYGPSPELTMRQVLLDANKIKSNGKLGRKTAYSGVWGEGPFKDHFKFTKGQWLTLLETDPEFAEGATETYLGVVRAGGSKAVLDAAEAEQMEEQDDYYGEEEADPVVE